MTRVAWQFTDKRNNDETVTLPLNPKTMSSPYPGMNLSFAFGTLGGADRIRAFETAPSTPDSFTFGGVILHKSHHDLLVAWTARRTVVNVHDHLNRTFRVIIQKYDPVERLPTARHPWRADYTMTCLMLKVMNP